MRGQLSRQGTAVSQEVSIHAPRAGGDRTSRKSAPWTARFQSTPPVRGATRRAPSSPRRRAGFNPRPPCGGRLRRGQASAHHFGVSIHAPRAGGDFNTEGSSRSCFPFQSTPPVRGATMKSPASGRRYEFQSTPPVRGATGQVERLLERRTACFNPRPPCGGRLRQGLLPSRHSVSIHAPRAGGDSVPAADPGVRVQVSIHAPRAGGDEAPRRQVRGGVFQSTPPVRGATLNYGDAYSGSWGFQSTPPVVGGNCKSPIRGDRKLHGLRFAVAAPSVDAVGFANSNGATDGCTDGRSGCS